MSAARKPLFAALLRRFPEEPVAAAIRPASDLDSRRQARRVVLDEIRDFLVAHDLDLSETNFSLAKSYFAGDPAVSAAVAALLREHGRLDDTMLAAIAQSADRAIRPEAIGEMAEHLARDLSECLRIIAASQTSGVEYRAALTAEVTSFGEDPLGALDRLIVLTNGVVEATRAMEEQLEVARGETERLRANLRRAQRDADRDHLTGLPNRRHFETRLGTLDPTATASVALCDIDDFKLVNDQHGHGTGDRVLKFVARLLRSELGDHAVVARYGGEEFVCLFEGKDVHEARDLIDAARERLSSRSLANQDSGRAIGHISFSAGVAAVTCDARAALRLADTALYAAKREGKNRVTVAT